jgi:hypothetical protein
MIPFLFHRQARELVAWLVAVVAVSQCHAATFPDWQQRQAFEVPAPGLIGIALPPATLDALRPGLEDLRLTDSEGRELSFLIQRPEPEPAPVRNPKSFKPLLRGGVTMLEIETGLEVPMNVVTLETPERDFIKAVRLEASREGQQFVTLVEGAPIFRQGSASELSVRFEPGAWTRLRLTIDDQRARPVAFTGARLHAANAVEAPTESMTLPVKSREEIDGETRLVLDLGFANLTLASLDLETPEALFQREVTVQMSTVINEEIQEMELRRGFIYALEASGVGVSRPRRTSVALERQVRSRELILLIRNLDSPPLAITAVRAARRPVRLLFQAGNASPHFLYLGNSQCSAPRYDLSGLGAQLKSARSTEARLEMIQGNPDYRVPETLPGLSELGAELDVRPWRYRKAVTSSSPGAQQAELDLELLAHARADLGDVRLLRDRRQVPYLIERTSLSRPIQPEVETVKDPKPPQLSKWKLTLPYRNLPVVRLECRSRTELFQRTVRVWEELADDRGGNYPSELGQANWRRTEGSKEAVLSLAFSRAPRSDTLFLETDNGDNPGIELDRFRLTYPVTRLVFKSAEPVTLYYGNPAAVSPRYDLSLVSGRLLRADKATAKLGMEEALRPSSSLSPVAFGGWVLWSVLGLVTAGLLFVIIRLLPSPAAGSTESTKPRTPEQK